MIEKRGAASLYGSFVYASRCTEFTHPSHNPSYTSTRGCVVWQIWPLKGSNERWAGQQLLQNVVGTKGCFDVFRDSPPCRFVCEPGLHEKHRLPVERSRHPRGVASFLTDPERRPCFEGTTQTSVLPFPCGTDHGLQPSLIEIHFLSHGTTFQLFPVGAAFNPSS